MNTNVDPNVIKEALNRIVDNIIDNDINTGKELLKKCNYSCNIIQKQQVISFITDIVYKNDGCAWIYFEEDIYHNWFSNIIIDSGFIERETVADDTFKASAISFVLVSPAAIYFNTS